MKGIIMVTVLVVMMAMSGMAAAGIVEDWPMDTPNTHQDPHILIDFENGTCKDVITSPTNKITFENDGVNPWIYACKNCSLNIYPDGHAGYVVNGECGAWCNIPGHHGNISFKHDVGHVSVLASAYSGPWCSWSSWTWYESFGLRIVAYNSSGVQIATSEWATNNLHTESFTRISVDRAECDISYVCIHDSGNFWLIDDLLITRKRGESGIAHCQKFIHSQGQDHWNESAHMNKTHPCNQNE